MTERRHRGRQLVVEMRTRATPQEVYEAWADPEEIARWFVDSSRLDTARGKAEVGSIFTWIFEKFGYEIPYEVVAADPGRRFALGGEAPKSGPFLLEVTIEREGGETLVTLVNSGFLDGAEWDEEFEGIVSGWTNALAALKLYLEKYRGRPKTAILAMKPTGHDDPYSRLLPYYATAEGLNRWLTTSAQIGEVGEPCSLRFASGRRLTGRVLTKTAWEMALSWEEIHGMLELKGFRFPGAGKVVGARVLSWDMPQGEAAALEKDLEGALERLAAELGSEVPAGARP
jgi:uncharacterized protein YndB with AHSA1/START domain